MFGSGCIDGEGAVVVGGARREGGEVADKWARAAAVGGMAACCGGCRREAGACAASGDDFERSWSGVRPELERRKSVVGQEEDVDDLLL